MVTGAATAVTATSATLNGAVTSNDTTTAVSVEYGLTTAYGSTVAATPASIAPSTVARAVSAALTGLSCNTLYHYRVVGASSVGTVNGDDKTLTTTTVNCPLVVSMNTASVNPTAPNTVVQWTVVFNVNVKGVDATDFALVPGGGVTGASITSVTGSGKTWTVSANTGPGYGSLGLNLEDDDSIVDTVSNIPLGLAGAGNGDFVGQVYAVPSRPPVLTKVSSTAAAVVGDVVTFTVTATNPYADDLPFIEVRDLLPAGMTFSSAAVTQGVVTQVGQMVTWNIPLLITGASAQLTLAVKLMQQGALTNTVEAWNATSASASVLVLASAVTHFHLDEPAGSWTGTAGEVIDSGGNSTSGRRLTTGTGTIATNTVNPSPTIASQSTRTVIGGFCNAANFDGKAVVEVPHSTAFDYTTKLSASAWIYPTARPTSDLYSILSNDTNYEFHLDTNGKLFWWWNQDSMTSSATIPLNTWTHIAITMDSTTGGGRQRIYINGVADATTKSWKGTLIANPCPFYIGGDINTAGTCTAPNANRNFRGMIDEVKLYGYELSAAEVQADMTLGRNCSGTFDHIRIEHDGSGSVCAPETLTVKACLDASCSTLYAGNVTVNMSPTGWDAGNQLQLVLTSGVKTIALSRTSTGTVTLGTTGVSPSSASATRCFNGATETCALTFAAASCQLDAVAPGANPKTRLLTKMAGTPFMLDVLALSGSGLNTGYTGTVKADLVDASASTCPSGAGLTTQQSLVFAASDAGRKTNVTFTYPTPMKDVRVRMQVGAGTPACSTDNFAIRPSNVSLTYSPAMATGSSPTDTPTIKAGASFTLNAAATPGYTGTLTQDATKLAVQNTTPAATVGVLKPSTLAVNASPAPIGNASYDEVGYVTVPAGAYLDATFTAVDQPTGCAATSTCDCVTDKTSNNNLSTSLVGSTKRYGCDIGSSGVSLGRFIPDHFTISNAVVTAACTAATPFSYFGQDGFGTAFTLTAQSVGNTTTKNYTGAFAKFNLNSYAGYGFTAATLPVGAVLASGAIAPTGSWNKGVAQVVAKHQISRPTALAASTNITVSAAPTDGEVPAAATGTAVGGATVLRYGRLRMQNMYGSERLPLTIPVRAQYWNGSAFVTNTDDSCTAVAVPPARTATPDGLENVYFYPLVAGKNQLRSTDTSGTIASPLAAGAATLNFSTPNRIGWLDVILNAPPYLQGDWANCLGQTGAAGLRDDFPCARATFGIYKSPLIYRRENY